MLGLMCMVLPFEYQRKVAMLPAPDRSVYDVCFNTRYLHTLSRHVLRVSALRTAINIR